jgi:hypothetical protein
MKMFLPLLKSGCFAALTTLMVVSLARLLLWVLAFFRLSIYVHKSDGDGAFADGTGEFSVLLIVSVFVILFLLSFWFFRKRAENPARQSPNIIDPKR